MLNFTTANDDAKDRIAALETKNKTPEKKTPTVVRLFNRFF